MLCLRAWSGIFIAPGLSLPAGELVLARGTRRQEFRLPQHRVLRESDVRLQPVLYSAWARGGFSSTGMSCQRATSLISCARKSRPLATTIGASIVHFVLQCNGKVGGVSDHNTRFLGITKHLPSSQAALNAPNAALDRQGCLRFVLFHLSDPGDSFLGHLRASAVPAGSRHPTTPAKPVRTSR